MDRIIAITSPISNQYLIVGKTAALLIDTGIEYNYAHLMRSFRAASCRPEKIVITHADGDHDGCLQRLQNQFPAVLCAASPLEAQAIQSGNVSRIVKPVGAIEKLFYGLAAPLMHVPPAAIQQTLQEGDTLPYLGKLTILETPGHTPSHISLWSEATKTLFSGDSIRIHGSHLKPSSGANTWNPEKAQVSFERQLQLQPEHIYGGHGIWHNSNHLERNA